jgi:hypothetical protein
MAKLHSAKGTPTVTIWAGTNELVCVEIARNAMTAMPRLIMYHNHDGWQLYDHLCQTSNGSSLKKEALQKVLWFTIPAESNFEIYKEEIKTHSSELLKE